MYKYYKDLRKRVCFNIHFHSRRRVATQEMLCNRFYLVTSGHFVKKLSFRNGSSFHGICLFCTFLNNAHSNKKLSIWRSENDSFKKILGKNWFPPVAQFSNSWKKKQKKIWGRQSRWHIFDFFCKIWSHWQLNQPTLSPNGHLLSHHLVGISCKPSSPKG